jgi:Tol biopolymer transport system component
MNESTDRLLVDWLAEGPDRGPVHGLERALAATRRTSQRPSWIIPERWFSMQLTMRPAFAPPRLLLYVAIGLLALALAGTVAFVASQQRQPAPPFGPAANGSIVIGIGSDLYLMNADGSALKPLDIGLGKASWPFFSPDGTKVAFISRPADNAAPYSLFVANADGSNARLVSGELAIVSDLTGMTWSPDGRSVVFPAGEAGSNRLYRVGLDGGEPQPITGPEADRRFPTWSPDGRWIAYKLTPRDRLTTSLAIARPDGTGERTLVSEDGAYAAFSGSQWTNDSSRLAYFRSSPSGHLVAVVNLDGKETLLSKGYEDAVNPAISPDDRHVVFGLASGTAIVQLDHPSSRVNLRPGLAECGSMFAPDGKTLLGFGMNCDVMYRIPLDNPEAAVKVALPAGGISNASWQRLAP